MAFSAVKYNLKLYISIYESRDCSTVSATGEFRAGWQWTVRDEAVKPEAENTMRVIGWMSRRSLWLATQPVIQIMPQRVYLASLMSPKSDRNRVPMGGSLA